MEYFGLSNVGMTRGINQDAYKIKADGGKGIFVLCDGMGGHRAGEVASKEAAEDIVNVLEELLLEDSGDIFIKITNAVSHANTKVFNLSKENPVYDGMGTTCDVCVITEDGANIGHIGDSRVYIYSSGGLFQITKDHSLAEEMLERGELTQEEARFFPRKNYITRALGTQESVRTDTYLAAFKQGDIILMCSDGLTNMVAEIDIAFILSRKITLKEMAEELVQRANDNGGTDNTTVVLIRR